ncbi:hypothetical protein [Paraburkholderia sp. CNPSo 3281]|nr:hypothetical protein [Paraburkholderia sp. CNPSo 3281]MCP3720475.1 hypothetical protein [Paraburkholderia sp. CNPSo 3281]
MRSARIDRDTELDNHALEAGEDEAQSDTDSAGSDVLPDRIDDSGDV